MELWFILTVIGVFVLMLSEFLQQKIQISEENSFSPSLSLFFVIFFQTVLLFIISLFIGADITSVFVIDTSI
jgi:hypothetical protein